MEVTVGNFIGLPTEEAIAELEKKGLSYKIYGDGPTNSGKVIYELSFYFYMKVPKNFSPSSKSFTEDSEREFLRWVSPDTDTQIYPEFFRNILSYPRCGVQHILSDERNI